MTRVSPIDASMLGKKLIGDIESERDSQTSLDGLKPSNDSLNKAIAWAKAHKRLIGISLAAIVCLLVVLVVAPVVGSKAKASQAPSGNSIGSSGLPRLILTFSVPKNAMDLMPPIMRQYVTGLNLSSSALQILDFVDEETLQAALEYLQSEPSLNLLVRDFEMSRIVPPSLIPSLPSFASLDQTLLDLLDQTQDMDTSNINFTALEEIALQAIGNSSSNTGRKLMQSSSSAVTTSASSISDPFYLNRSQYYIDQINMTGAWKYTTGSPTIVVAVIDTGADLAHPDLADRLWINKGEIPGNGIDDDGNGYIDDVYGYDFAGQCNQPGGCGGQCNSVRCCSGKGDPTPDSSTDSQYFHGTHVAGIIAAVQNNAQGGTGVAPNVKIMVLKVSDCISGSFSSAAIFKAFDYAHKMGAHIVSCSFTSGNPGLPGQPFFPISRAPVNPNAQWTASYVTAMQPLANKGILTVVAAGNDATNLDLLVNMGYFYAPCTIPLPNVLCVGATDGQGQNPASFSNYGSSNVHLGSPGVQIYSTYFTNISGSITHNYAPQNGTSMATPIVSGAAAIALSLLGANDGNFFKAAQLRSVLLNSAYRPAIPSAKTSPLPFMTQARVNVGVAAWMAQIQNGGVLASLSPVYGTNLIPSGLFSLPSTFIAAYYSTLGSQFNSLLVGPPLEPPAPITASPVGTFPTFRSFKYTGQFIASFSTFVQLKPSGSWNIRLLASNADPRTSFVFINGQAIQLDTAQSGVFSVSSAGWFNLEVRICWPTSGSTFTLSLKAPNAASFSSSSYAFQTLGPTSFALPDAAQNAPLSSSWQVFYNKVNVTATPLSLASLGNITLDASYQFSTVIRDPGAVGALGSALFPSDSMQRQQTSGAVGFMQVFLLPTATLPSSISFNISCKGCQLLMDSVVLIDAWEPLITSFPISKTSSCIKMSSGLQPHQLVIKFAVQPLSTSTMTIAYADCSLPRPVYTSLNGVVPLTYNPLVWQPNQAAVNTQSAAFIGGLQCDLYSQSSRLRLTTSFNAQSMTPLYKVRLPQCVNETLAMTSCGLSWNFTIESLFPGLGANTLATAPGATYGLRCWTHWSSGFSIRASATPLSAKPIISLGGIIVSGPSSTLTPNRAPTTTLLTTTGSGSEPFHQLLSVDWFNVTTDQVLSVLDGPTALNINFSNMKLPITGLADADGIDLLNKSQVMRTDSYGAYSATAFVPWGDAQPLVLNDLSRAFLLTGAPTPQAIDLNNGLNKAYAYNRVNGSAVRYTIAPGYYYTALAGLQTIQVVESAASATSLVMGNVTVRNFPAFRPSSTSSTSTFEIFAPAQRNLFSYAICKTSRPDGTTSFGFSTPANTAGPQWDSNTWGRPVWTPNS